MEFLVVLVVLILVGLIIGYALGGTLNMAKVREKNASPQININIVHVDNRQETHYTLQSQASPKVVYGGDDWVTFMPAQSPDYAILIEGRDEMKLLRGALNDIAKVDKWG
jgi:hypothetical protein